MTNPLLSPSPFSFRFENNTYRSLGNVNFTLPIPQSMEDILVPLDVVDIDTTHLIGIDILKNHDLMTHNRFAKPRQFSHNNETYYIEDWFLPLFRTSSSYLHTIIQPAHQCSINYTQTEFRGLHRHFFHPSQTKRFNLLKRSNPTNTDTDTLCMLT